MKRKIVALLLTCMLLFSFVAFADDGLSPYAEPITLTTCVSISETMQNFMDQQEDVLTNNIWFKTYAEELGINIVLDWTAPSSQYNDKLNAQIATNNIPDIVAVNSTQLKQLVDYRMIYDLTDLFEEYATDMTRSMMEADLYAGIEQATFDGKVYALPQVSGNRDGANYWWIRFDWLEKVGLEEPKTLDELVEVMYAFAQDDPDGNGVDDTYGMGLTKGLFGGNVGLAALGEGIGAYEGWVRTEDGIVYGKIQPEMKQMLELLAKLYADGVLDREFIVKDGNKLNEDIIAGKVGLFGGQHWHVFSPLQNSRTAEPDADWRAISIVSDDDNVPKTMLGGSASTFYAVSINCEHPEAIVKLYNLFYKYDPVQSPDYDDRYHGYLDNDPSSDVTQWYNWAIVRSYYPIQNLAIHQGVDKYFYENDESVMENISIHDHVILNQQFLDGDEAQWNIYRWSGPNDYSGLGRIDYYDHNDMFVLSGYTGGNTDSMTLYNTTLNELIMDTFTRIITGDVGIEAFDDFVAQWKELGGDLITAEVNS